MIRVRIHKRKNKPLPGHPNRDIWRWRIDKTHSRGADTIRKGDAPTWKEACQEAHLAYLTQKWGEANMRQVQEFAKRIVSVQVIPHEQWQTFRKESNND